MSSRALPQLHAGVIDEARSRQRRRCAVLAAAAAVAVTLAILATRPSAPTPAVLQRTTAPSAVLAQSPYMGVACRVPNATACDRIGLAVWLRAPAVAVRATIAGRPLKLDVWQARPYADPRQRPRTMFVGYLQPAGLVSNIHIAPGPGPVRWWAPSPSDSPAPLVRLRIDYGSGPVRVTYLRVPLEAGWG